ncbi:hypothetical protein [Colwellia sp. C1TZA3]|uniref:hypothetical protein n=1 Tax=Colwellia sp. C1TZA3 TaxID=2508879 RepID=UPI0011BA2E21|nr:hypothetical protein [Colwellia sp. C1TZA3]TWX72715.1 hypothetical protein ESZ39_07465 [Colwellia sp. C1TZA3]
MTSLQVAEKSEKSLTEILLVVILVGSLMASFIFYFLKQQGQISQAGFASIAQVFSARVNGIRGQWFMDLNPRFVSVASHQIQADGGRILQVPVNKSGWVDSDNKSLSCQIIWHYVMEAPLLYMKDPIGAVLVKQQKQVRPYCQYSLPSGEYFTYQRHNGKVSEIKLAH